MHHGLEVAGFRRVCVVRLVFLLKFDAKIYTKIGTTVKGLLYLFQRFIKGEKVSAYVCEGKDVFILSFVLCLTVIWLFRLCRKMSLVAA